LEITDGRYEYNKFYEFYKSIRNDWEKYVAVNYLRTVGDVAFTVCLFVPRRAPYDLFKPYKKLNNIKV
jgi:molecular chaperone HtpG